MAPAARGALKESCHMRVSFGALASRTSQRVSPLQIAELTPGDWVEFEVHVISCISSMKLQFSF